MIQELQTLLVRLVGDGSGFTKTMHDAEKEAEHAESKFVALGESAEHFLEALGVSEFLKEAKAEWFKAETAAFRLTSALKASGEDVAHLTHEYKEFAEQLEHTTTYSHVQTEELLKTAASFGLVGDSAKSAVKEAMALAAATDTSASAALRLTRAIEEGDTERAQMYSRMIPQLRGVKDEAEFTAKYQKLIAQGQITLQDELKTGAGRAQQFANRWDEALEQIGKSYAEISSPLKIVKKTTIDLWESMGAGTQRTAVLAAGWAANVTLAVTSITALNALLPGLKGNLLALAKNPFLWAAAATVALASLTKELMSQTRAAKEHAEALEKLERASKGYRESIGEGVGKNLEKADGRKEQMEEELKRVKEELESAEAREKRASTGRPFNRVARGLESISRTVGGPESSVLADWRKNLELAKEETHAWREAVERVDAAIQKLGKQENKAGIERAIKEAKKAAEEAGMDADALKRDELEKKGATQDQLAELDALTSKRKLREQILAMEKEARTAGMDDKQKQLAEADMAGASKQQKDRIVGLQREKELAETLAKVKEDLKTPEQKLAEETSKLNELYEKGMLTAEQYAEANQKLRDSILGVAAAEQAAMKFGSAQDMAARRQYFGSLALSPGNAPPPRPNFDMQAANPMHGGLIANIQQLVEKLKDTPNVQLAFVGGGG